MNFIFQSSTKKGKEDYGSISVRYRKAGINRKYSISYCITVEEWDNYRLHRYQSNVTMPSIGITYDQFVHILEKIKHFFDKEYVHEDVKKKISQIKCEVLYGTTEAVQSNKTRGFWLDAFIKQYYDELISGRRLKVGRTVKVKEASAKTFLTLYKKILSYQHYRYRRFRLEDINMEFQREFVFWLKKKGHYPNGIHSILKNLGTVMRAAYDDHFTENDITKYHDFITREVEIDHISLTQEQINEICDLDLSSVDKVKELIESKVTAEKKKEKYLNEVTEHKVQMLCKCRDVFIVGCLTGQRISDYSRINKGMITRIKDEWFIGLVQKKTSKKVYIPLSSQVKGIIDKYGGKMPDISGSLLNTYLGKLFEYLGWSWKPKIEGTRKGRTRGDRFCDMVSSHTARRSFATNAYTSGINIGSIMAVTGHSTERMFRRYIKQGTEDRALKAAEDLAGVMEL